MADRDYKAEYETYWRHTVELPDGSLNRDQVMRELSDYSWLMEEVSGAYDELTGNRVSKPFTRAFEVINIVNERISEACNEDRIEEAVEAERQRLARLVRDHAARLRNVSDDPAAQFFYAEIANLVESECHGFPQVGGSQ